MASHEPPPPPPPPEANPNPGWGDFPAINQNPRLFIPSGWKWPPHNLHVHLCPGYIRGLCRLSPLQCNLAHPPPSVLVQHDKVIVCNAYLWNMCPHGMSCCYFHPPSHIHEALLREVGIDFQRPGDMKMPVKDEVESVGSIDSQELNKDNNLLAECIFSDEIPIECIPDIYRIFAFPGSPPIPSYDDIVGDVKRYFGDAKIQLKETLKSKRVCLSTETWIDEHGILHMALRGHWVDDKWKLCNKMLSFCSSGRTREDRKLYCEKIEKALLDWGISTMLTVTADSTDLKDPVVQWLRFKTKDAKDTILGHQCLQIKSLSHVVSEVVKEALEYYRESISRVRFAVLNVARTSKDDLFKKCAEKEGLKFEHPLFLHDKSMWDSTYMLLEKAVGLQKAFERFMKEDSVYLSCFDIPEARDGSASGWDEEEEEIAPGPPSETDWENTRHLVTVLKLFYKVMRRLSNPTIVTANTFVYELLGMQVRLAQLSKSEDQAMASLAEQMKKNMDKHWGEFDDLNPFLVVAMVLDPRYKLKGLKVCLDQAANNSLTVEEFIEKVENKLICLYKHYIAGDTNSTNNLVSCSINLPSNPVNIAVDEDHTKSIREQFAKLVAEEGGNHEVMRYLSECCEIHHGTFNILDWWRCNSFRYPTLSKIAKDVLAIPVCATFYEEAFNTGFHELDHKMKWPRDLRQFFCLLSNRIESSRGKHPCLFPKKEKQPRDLREILVVGKDWFRRKPPPADFKESWLDKEETEEGESDEDSEEEER